MGTRSNETCPCCDDRHCNCEKPFAMLESDMRAFMRIANQTISREPQIAEAELRANLIVEEALETAIALLCPPGANGVEAAMKVMDIVHRVMPRLDMSTPADATEHVVRVIDGMIDEAYVIIGTAVTCGTPLDLFWQEVHRSNMAKVGGGFDARGKLLKPAGWKPPNIRGVFERNRPLLAEGLRNV